MLDTDAALTLDCQLASWRDFADRERDRQYSARGDGKHAVGRSDHGTRAGIGAAERAQLYRSALAAAGSGSSTTIGAATVEDVGATILNPSGTLNPGTISVNGQRETSNYFSVNGSDAEEDVNAGTAIIPNLDAISEFRIVTSNFDAEYGEFSGGQVSVMTKSGSNHSTEARSTSCGIRMWMRGIIFRRREEYTAKISLAERWEGRSSATSYSFLPTIREPGRHKESIRAKSACRRTRTGRATFLISWTAMETPS